MATETTDGGQASLDAIERMLDDSRPVEERFHDDFVDHDPAPGQPSGGDGIAWYWAQFGESFSDVDHDVIETIATPTKYITIADTSGTHTGDFMGYSATGKRFTVSNVQVIGFRDGLASDRWGSTDQLGILQQLGLA